MLVRCSNCHTQFSLDARQVGHDGAPIRCSVCGYVFRPSSEEKPSWRIKTVDGEHFTASDLATLRAWIAEGRLHPDDEVSRAGQQWLKLGAMPEFTDVFAGFPDLPVMLRTFEPTPLPSLPDLGPPPDFDHSGGGEDILPSILEGSSNEINLLDIAASAELGLMLGGEDSSTSVSLNPLADLVPSGDFLPEDLTPGLRISEEDASVPAPNRVAEEVTPAPRTERGNRAPFPSDDTEDLRDHAEVDSWSLGAVSEPMPADVRSPGHPDGSGTFLSSAHESLGASDEDRHGAGWGWWVMGIAAVAAVGVAVAWGPVRERLQQKDETSASRAREAEVTPGPVAEPLPPEVEAARRALHRADKLAQVEAALQSRLEDEDLAPKAIAALKLAQVELLSTRALLARVAAAVDTSAAQTWGYRADDDAERAGQVFAGIDTERLSEPDVARARTRLRLVQGRPLGERSETGGNRELEMILQAAPLWREPHRSVAPAELDGWIEGFQSLPEPSAIARLLLALSHTRRGDAEVAGRLVDAILAESPEQASAVALRARLDGAESPMRTAAAAPASRPTVSTPSKPSPKQRVAEVSKEASAPAPERGGRGGQGSVDRWIHSGCDAVDANRPNDAIPDLVKAFDRRPHDVDALTCLGTAHFQLGNMTTANRYFQLALDRSPRLVPALRGAARVAKRNAQRERARELYGRLLADAPGDREAKTYLQETAPSSPILPPAGSVPAQGPAGDSTAP